MQWLRHRYGAGPLNLVGLLACFAVAAYAATRVLQEGGWAAVFLWFILCVVAHDLIGWPVYAWVDRRLQRAESRQAATRGLLVPWINHVRAPAFISGVLFAIAFPLIFRLSDADYQATTGFTEDVYLFNWVGVSALLFAVSGALYAGRWALARRRRGDASYKPAIQ
ncbi:hypothetical protein H7K33_16120 [Mycobacterium paraense]|jgi:hypothetical protein|uniref:Lipoprotein n=1 Tax=Mycobacterium paraense TaxID=767916 RepID=A0A1X2A4I3_9MYCO|nr:hypothetical protein [Mycobacterium paraense]MCV7443765.1 hypothetical protein [Mycobacterium paraense]ORW38333.1 hypothetical protein AWB90_23890 [Mycobacterium paraense]ORW47521.1 hypothetical protein AWB89_10365 [Mycobacterium paraense]